jgi:quinol monooxygenase YgiN
VNEIFIFARFHARDGTEEEVAAALREVIGGTRAEPGCRSAEAFRSLRDPQLFFIHSRWRDEAALETHAALPDTKQFIERVQALIDHPLDINRTHRLNPPKRATTRIGFMEGQFKVPDDFDTMFAEEIEEMFYGEKVKSPRHR